MHTARKIIKEARLKLGLSAPELSKKLGFKSKSHVWQVETGYRQPSLLFCKRLITLCRTAGIKTDLTFDNLRD